MSEVIESGLTDLSQRQALVAKHHKWLHAEQDFSGTQKIVVFFEWGSFLHWYSWRAISGDCDRH